MLAEPASSYPTAAKSRRRSRPIVLISCFCTFLFVIIVQGPPLFTPASKATASRWADRINYQASSVYQSSHMPYRPRVRQALMLLPEGDRNQQQWYERALDIHVKHGEQWGVPTHVLRHTIVNEDNGFNKLAYLLNLVMNEHAKAQGEGSEWIVWLDPSSVIMNAMIPWTAFLPPREFNDKHILLTRDAQGLKTGTMFLRVHPWTISALSEALALPHLRPEIALPLRDQSALQWVCDRPGYIQHLLYQPHHWWNRHYEDTPTTTEVGALLMQFSSRFQPASPTSSTSSNDTPMLHYLDKVTMTPKAWLRNLPGTPFPAEIDAYWNLLRRSRRILEQSEAWRNRATSKNEKNLEVVKGAELDLITVVLRETDDLVKVEAANSKLEALLVGA